MKAHCNNDGTFTGLIKDRDTYIKVRDGKADWKEHIKPKLKNVIIPFELFRYFMYLDKNQFRPKENNNE